jgi:hypothetical protein
LNYFNGWGDIYLIFPSQDDQSPKNSILQKKILFDHIDTSIWPFHISFPHHAKNKKCMENFPLAISFALSKIINFLSVSFWLENLEYGNTSKECEQRV